MTLIDGNKQTKKVLIDISVMSLSCNTEKSTIQGEAWMTKTSFCYLHYYTHSGVFDCINKLR